MMVWLSRFLETPSNALVLLAVLMIAGGLLVNRSLRKASKIQLKQQQLLQSNAVLQERISQQNQALNNAQEKLHGNDHQFQQLTTDNARLQAENNALTLAAADKNKFLDDAKSQLGSQFEDLAQKIFEQKTKVFTDQNRSHMGHLLAPLKEQIQTFHARINDVHLADSKDRAGLRSQIVELQKLSTRANKEAADLTRALKGDNKLQGNWGEVILERVLEDSGLRKGHEYETQNSYQNNEGRQLRPDVIVHLPESKDVIIDSKVSLLAYEQAVNSEHESQRGLALDAHIAALKQHIKSLAAKHYQALPGIKSLDFVLMFLPIEPAFTAAMEHEPRLFSDAYDQGIMLVSPTTLLITLRTIHNIWRVERQNQNAQEIAQRAASIHNKLRSFVDDMEKLGRSLNTANNSYDLAMKKLSSGQGNLIKQAKDFVDLGVKVKKEMPSELADKAELELSLGLDLS